MFAVNPEVLPRKKNRQSAKSSSENNQNSSLPVKNPFWLTASFNPNVLITPVSKAWDIFKFLSGSIEIIRTTNKTKMHGIRMNRLNLTYF